MISDIKNYLSSFYHGFNDWRTNRKIIVIESDDWGSIRMPDRRTYDLLIKKGYDLNGRPFERFDSIASETDFEHLLSTLSQFSDKKGKQPVVTLNVITGNPDFERIEGNSFSKFFVEDFTETIERYNRNKLSTWNDAVKSGMLYPQFHGREHVNVFSWLNSLQDHQNEEVEAFYLGLMGIPPKNSPYLGNQHQIAFNYDTSDPEKITYIGESIKDGIKRFKKFFGFLPESFIAPAYTWDNLIEGKLIDNGIKILQGGRYQILPLSGKRIKHSMGEKKRKLTYLVRNAFFEPSTIIDTSQREQMLGQLIKRTDVLFAQRRPVVIGSHRLNYVGVLDERNRIVNLYLLKRYLSHILKKYPDIEFLTTVELAKLISNEDSNT